MEIDSKHKVLFAIYAEYQKDIIDMSEVTYKALDMDSKVFKTALLKLQNEGFIDGLITHPPNERRVDRINVIMINKVMPTRFGVEYVENKLEIKKDLTSKEKLRLMAEKFGKLGFEILKEVAIEKLNSFI